MFFPNFANPQFLNVVGSAIIVLVVVTTYLTLPFRQLKEWFTGSTLKPNQWEVMVPAVPEGLNITISFAPAGRFSRAIRLIVGPTHPNFNQFKLLKEGDVVEVEFLQGLLPGDRGNEYSGKIRLVTITPAVKPKASTR